MEKTELMPGLDLNIAKQLEMLTRLSKPLESIPFPTHRGKGLYCYENEFFSYGDASVLYGMLKLMQPRTVVEVGSGYSTCLMLDTISTPITTIDLCPDRLLDLLGSTSYSNLSIRKESVLDTPLELFTNLKPSDILFIDSSHCYHRGSDVDHLLHLVIPLLASGVYIHFHDVFWPFEYPGSWLNRGWNECPTLKPYLHANQNLEIVFFNSFLNTFYPEKFHQAVPLSEKNPGGSLWLRKRQSHA